jgi:lia operon protein LiaG
MVMEDPITKIKKMKKMKYILPLIAALSIGSLARAQEFKVQADNTKEARLTLDGFTDNLPIEGYNGTEIIVTTNSHDFEPNERSKGLKPIYASGVDNTGIGIAMEKSGNHISLRCLLPITKGAEYKIKVPENMALDITRDCARGGETTISNIKNEIEFKGCQDISLKNVTGPLVISTISGNVNVTFTEISKDKSISIASVSGEVDVTLPAKAAFNLEMGTVSGNMYSDFDFPASNNDMRRIGGSNIRASLNGGGVDIKLHSISGNIYLRKS